MKMLLNLYRYEIPTLKIIRYYVGVEEDSEITCLFDDRLKTILCKYNKSEDINFTKVNETGLKNVQAYAPSLSPQICSYGTSIPVYPERKEGYSQVMLFNPLVIKDLTHRRMVHELENMFLELFDNMSGLPNFLMLLNMCLTISGHEQAKEHTIVRAINEAKTSSDSEIHPLCYLWFLLGIDSVYDDLSDSRSESVLLISSSTKHLFKNDSS